MLHVYTNENLQGINDGLDVRGHVLSVLGSGDQAFTFLERADYVTGIDTSIEQLRYVEKRIELLKDRLYDEFLYAEENPYYSPPGYLSNRNEYLRKRLDKIRENLGKLTLKQGDVTEQDYDELDRIYFSNSLDDNLLYTTQEKTKSMFNRLFTELRSGAIIYITEFLREYECGFNQTDSVRDIKRLEEFFEELKENEKLASSQLYFRWIPKVFKKRQLC